MRKYFLASYLLLFTLTSFGQDEQYTVALIGFYNVENLFDTLDTPDVRDTEFSPEGEKRYNSEIYIDKLNRLSQVVSEIGTDVSPDGLAILGVSEVENRDVLDDLVQQKNIKSRNYQIVHYDSPDKRGIDVALLYQPKYFKLTGSKAHPLKIYDDSGDRVFTRDVLHVSGVLNGDEIHVLVNHWPSRSGGEKASQWRRNAAAMLCKNIIDSLNQIDPNSKVILMGDLNDNPTSPSVKKILNAKGKTNEVKASGLYNPMHEKFKKGYGTNAWRDAWSLFDQMIISHSFLDKKQEGYFFYETRIFKERYMIQRTGQYKGYPKRAFNYDNYAEGYSDHFPVYTILLKLVDH